MYKIVFSFFVILNPFVLAAQTDFITIISYLASDSLEGRAPATQGEKLAANYIIHYFEHVNLSTKKQKFFFSFDNKTDTASNIIALLDNQKDSTILLSAHYDHLGWGNKKSREILKKHQIHNGADDNASGVAIMLELAKWLASQKDSLQYNYVFVAYSAHELGLFGSKYFSESKEFQKLKLKMALNFDMVGRLNKINPILKIGGTMRDTTYNLFIHQYENANLHFRLVDEQLLQSDAKFLYEKNIPTFTFTTGIHDDYHRASDDSNKINYKGLEITFSFLKELLIQISE